MRYTNPILYGDYSDPDVIRVEKDFFMVSSSFTYLPGIPVLRSRDLVHWEIAGYAAESLPFKRYEHPAHKRGPWAPSIRWRAGLFYVYVCLPDEGLVCFTAENPAGPWVFHWVKDVTGWIDPCPLFEEDGSVWLIHALAASRIGINNLLFVHRMSDDGMRVLDKGVLVYNGADHGDTTVEGPKFYRRNGTYWILCPAGGVREGYQLALRAENPAGPYERKVVLSRGDTAVNGPHQGGWFDDGRGGDWFIHFQDVGVYGRIPHLQPVDWSSGWPVMGKDGTPVPGGETGLEEFPVRIPAGDDFPQGPGKQWQWQANPDPAWAEALRPGLRLFAAPADSLFEAGNFLSQRMQCRNFDMTLVMRPELEAGDAAGLGMMGYEYTCAALEDGRIVLRTGKAAEHGWRDAETVEERIVAEVPWSGKTVVLRMRVREGTVSYAWGTEEKEMVPLGGRYPMCCGGWTGARPGIFCMNRQGRRGGFADIIRVDVQGKGEDRG